VQKLWIDESSGSETRETSNHLLLEVLEAMVVEGHGHVPVPIVCRHIVLTVSGGQWLRTDSVVHEGKRTEFVQPHCERHRPR